MKIEEYLEEYLEEIYWTFLNDRSTLYVSERELFKGALRKAIRFSQGGIDVKNKLDPCPFEHYKGHGISFEGKDDGYTWYGVKCDTCECAITGFCSKTQAEYSWSKRKEV